MPLQWQPVSVPLGASQDEGQAPFTLPVPLLAQLQNARVVKSGAIEKRPGWAAQAALTSFERALSVGDELFTIQRRSISTGAPVRLGSVNASLQRIDYHQGALGTYALSEVEVLERSNIVRDVLSGDGTGSIASSGPDFAVSANTGLAVIAWEVGVPTTASPAQHVIFAKVIDVNTRQVVDGPRQISTTSGSQAAPRVVLNDATHIVVVWDRAGSNEIRARAFDCTARTWGTDTVLVNNLNNVQIKFDANEIVGGTGYYIIFRNTTPVVQINSISLVTSIAVTTLGEDANASAAAVAVYPDSASNNLWCAWYDSVNGLRACIRQVTVPTNVVLATTTMEVVTDSARQITWGPGLASTTMILCWTTDGAVAEAATGYGRKQTKFRTLTTAGVKGTQNQVADVELISKAYSALNGFTYAAVLYDGSDVDAAVPGLRSVANQVAFTMCICDTTDAPNGSLGTAFRCAATWAQGEAGRKRLHSSVSSFRPVLVEGETEHWWVLAPEFDQTFISPIFVGRPGVDLCRQRITTLPEIYAARIGDNVVFSGGVPQVWDGAYLNEYGFLVPPENGLAVDGGAGGSLTAGAYGVRFVFEYRLATGDIVQSAPSDARPDTVSLVVTVAATNNKISSTVPTLSLTRKYNESSPAGGVVVRAYRTEANGTRYYSEGDFQSSNGFKANFAIGAALAIQVGQADATAITHPVIYNDGGLLAKFAPPALSFIHTHRNRLFGIVAENRRQVAFTHDYVVGELPGWHPNLVIDIPDEAVALATIDEKLVILCRHGVFLISGDGPDRKGLNSDYQQPFRLNSPHGCKNAASVVSFPNGVMFLSDTGFCMMDRKTDISRVGGPVEDTVATYPFAIASLVVPEDERIYWSMVDTRHMIDATGGRTVVYDWRHNVWSVDKVGFPGELAPEFTFHTSLARTKDGVFSTIAANAALYLESGSEDPGGQWIYTQFKTGMLHLGSNQLFQRARWLTVLGEKLGIHALAVTVDTFAHATSAPQTQSFVWTDPELSVLPDYALKMHLKNQKGAFFQVTIADGPDPSFPTLADPSASFVGLMLEMGLKKARPQMAQTGMK